MKFTIFQKPDSFSKKIEDEIILEATKAGLIYDNNDPELVIVIGGDGSFLKATQYYINKLDNLYFFGLNIGNLGFFYDFDYSEIKEAFKFLASCSFKIEKLHLLKIEIDKVNGGTETKYALNEARIENPFHTLICDVYFNNVFFEKFRGTGLLVCSPIGSSGYNKSIGGAVMKPTANIIEFSEIAPITNNVYRSLGNSSILEGNDLVTIKGDFEHAVVGYDYLVSDIVAKELRITLSDKYIQVIHQNDYSYINKLFRSFIK